MSAVARRTPAKAGSSTGSRSLRRDVGRIGLMFTSVGSVIGSGWLLGALNATTVAGPAAILSWIIGAAAIMLLALIHAELGGMHHVNGGVVRFPHYAFGSLVGFNMGWIYWLGSVTLAPVETEAALQYGDKWVHQAFGFHLVQLSKSSHSAVVLSAAGYIVAAVLMLIFTLINLWGVRRLSESNTAVVWWKIAIPVLTVIVLVVAAFSTAPFTAGNGFAPAGIKGILEAIATGGVVFAYLGFEQAIQFGGESRDPQRNIPFAVIGAMVIGTIIYIALDIAFVGALNPKDAAHGWANLSFTNQFGPYAALASGLGLGFLAFLLYVDAFLSPAGTGLIYAGSSARVSYALGRNGYIPKAFGRLDSRGVPWVSVVFAFAVGMIVFLPFPGWQKLVAFITSATVIIYAAQCLSLAAMRDQLPDHPRPFRLPAIRVIAPVGFIISNLIVLFAGWTTDWKLFAAIGIGLVLMAVSQLTRKREERVHLDWAAAMWMWPWLIGLMAICYLSSFEGGHNTLHFGVDMAVTAVFSIVIYYFALSRRLPAEVVQERMELGADEHEESDVAPAM
jgi:amino acid transporter